MPENGMSRLVLGSSQCFGCRLFHFDPVVLSDRPDLEYRRYHPLFQKNNRIQRILAGMGTTGGLGCVRCLSPVGLRSDNRWHRLLNELFSRLRPARPSKRQNPCLKSSNGDGDKVPSPGSRGAAAVCSSPQAGRQWTILYQMIAEIPESGLQKTARAGILRRMGVENYSRGKIVKCMR